MAENKIVSTRKGGLITKKRKSLKAPKNNIRNTSSDKAILPTKRNKRILSEAKKTLSKVRNKSGVKNRRDYIAKTAKSGADEFNNTKIKAKKSGPAFSTGELAKFNKNKLIRGSAKGVRNLKGASSALMIAGEAAGRSGMLGKKVKASYKEEDRRKSELNKIADSKIKTAKKFLKGNRSSAPKGPNRTQRRKRK